MKDVPEEWAEYARIQHKLATRDELDDTSWGLEYALDQIVAAKCVGTEAKPEQVQIDLESRSRRERSRAAQLREAASSCEIVDLTASLLEARSILTFLKINSPDYELLITLGKGWSYKQIAAHYSCSEDSLRKRASRGRKKFKRLI